ncbi:CGNR zinc finger domain-containing protein [Sphaerisporangium aureirubrum]|uniref:CGNR zinc finger domain-containing protein n=1 Tax=Sphaerisporangium aureirubrum TaxID=1544736 RepID=A0ABW1NW91_9ACTN
MDEPAVLLRDFVNTYVVGVGADDLASPAELAVWLRERGLISGGDRAGDDDWALAVSLREGLRAVLGPSAGDGAAEGGDGDHAAGLEGALAALPLRVTVVGGVPGAEPVGEGVRRGLGLIAVAVLGARADGMWDRLKVCAEHTCQWAFIDLSKNRSRSWCSMRVCGNRTKTRAYRARRRPAPVPHP